MKFWELFLKQNYGIEAEISRGKIINQPRELANTYLLIKDYEKIISQYESKNKNFEDTSNELGNLLLNSLGFEHGTFNIKTFTGWKYLIEHGAPITYDKGQVLSYAVSSFGIKALKIVNSIPS